MAEPTLEDIQNRQEVMQRQIRELRELREPKTTSPHSCNSMQVTMPPPTDGERAVHRVEKMAILLGGMLLAAIGFIWNQSSRMDDMKADIASERASREAFDNWSNQEHTTVRGYIWTGKIEPMKPKPTPREAVK